MLRKEFTGKLEGLEPSKILDQQNINNLDNFFLILGLIFNDIKGLITFDNLIEENYRRPEDDEVSAHAGEFNGIRIQINKIIIGTIAEFIVFLEKNQDITSSIKFQLFLKKINNEDRERWYDLIRVSSGKYTTSENEFSSIIKRIRSNVAFHYDQSLKELRKGFLKSFFSESKNLKQHKKAYYSLGVKMRSTRFYYADAAIDDYIRSLLKEEYFKTVTKIVNDMNHSINALMGEYLKTKK